MVWIKSVDAKNDFNLILYSVASYDIVRSRNVCIYKMYLKIIYLIYE